jgi:hypothetical protein
MKRSILVQTAHNALRDREKGFAEYLLNQVNLTLLEKEIITRSEINGERLETICCSLVNKNKKHDLSYSNGSRIKQVGMIKIGENLKKQNQINF